MWLVTPSFFPLHSHYITKDYSLSTLFVMVRKVISLPTLLTTYQSHIQFHYCSRPNISSALFNRLSHLYFISYARALQFSCTGPFLTMDIFQGVIFSLMWPFSVQELLCFIDGNKLDVCKMNIDYCRANIEDTKRVKPRYSTIFFPPWVLAVA